MRILFYLIFCITFISCQTETKPFLDFDQIDYYSVSISEDEQLNYRLKENKSNVEKNFFEILDGNVPINLKNDSLINTIESTNFFKHIEVNENLNKDFLNCFFTHSNSKSSFITISSICVHIYRDILIFRKNSKIVGVALVCFSCDAVKYYSQNGYQHIQVDFQKIEVILNSLKN